MLPVSLDCQFWSLLRLVASFSGLSVFYYPFVLCTLCYQLLWLVSFWLPLRLVYPMLPVSLDCQICITPSSCVPYVASFSGLSVLITPSSCCQFLWIVWHQKEKKKIFQLLNTKKTTTCWKCKSWLGKSTRCGGLNQLAWEKHEMWWFKPAGLRKSTRCGGLNQLAWGKARNVVG